MNNTETNAPYSNACHDLEISQAIHADRNYEPVGTPMVQNVSVIGALFNANMELWDKDKGTIASVLKLLKKSDVTFAQQISFHFYNLLPPLKNDFLEAAIVNGTAPNSEVVIVAGVWGVKASGCDFRSLPLSLQTALKDFSSEELVGKSEKGCHADRITTISALQTDPKAWALASNNVGAKFVITDGTTGLDFINTDDLLHGDYYRAVIPTEEGYITTPNGAYGVLVRDADLPEISTAIAPTTDLGKRILSL